MTTEGKLLVGGIILLLLAGGYGYFVHSVSESNTTVGTTTQSIPFSINGTPITLVDGVSEVEAAPGSASKITTRYFGNAVSGDFNGDSATDTAFLVTQTTGGSGTFYYLATSLGGEAELLGDRIAPQTTEWRDGTIIVNFADRKAGEPMTQTPTVGVSRYFKVENNTLVEIKQTTTDDVYGNVTGTISISPTCPVERNPPEPNCMPRAFVTEITAFEKLSDEMVARTTSSDKGSYTLKLPIGDYVIHASTIGMFPRCADKDVSIKSAGTITLTISCDSGIR